MSETRDTILIEADTIESALEALTEGYGSSATIVSAERVRRGGVAGFFAKEVVELVAVPPPSRRLGQAEGEVIDDRTGEAPPAGVDSAFAQLLGAAEQAESAGVRPSTNVALLDHREPGNPAPADLHSAPASNQTPAEGIRWDVPRLIEIGLPGSLIEGLMPLDPADDLAHVERLARSIAPLTGDLPAEPHCLIGTRSGRHSAYTEISDRSRPVHLVLAYGDELDVTKPPPAIVSWADDEAAPTAVAVAWQTGAILGWSMCWDGSLRRVTPVDAALAIRSLLETR